MDMDFSRNPRTDKPEPVADKPVAKVSKSKKGVPLAVFLLVVVLLLGAGAGAFWWHDKQAKDQAKKQGDEIAALLKNVQEAATAAANADAPAEEAETKVPTAEQLANMEDAIKSGNTAALEGYMAATVRVIIAASEGVGDRTPTEAISDLKYLDSATDPWDFALPAATLSGWGTGDYKLYFPESALVGQSADDMVVSFTFDSDAKISGIFMAMDASSL